MEFDEAMDATPQPKRFKVCGRTSPNRPECLIKKKKKLAPILQPDAEGRPPSVGI
jgi:hypothetical protein